RLQELLAELDQVVLHFLGLRLAARALAAVARLAVDVFQEGGQLVAELDVVVRAAQPPGVAEVDELDAADLALAVHQLRLAEVVLADGGAGFVGGRLLRLLEGFVGALPAPMEVRELLFGGASWGRSGWGLWS